MVFKMDKIQSLNSYLKKGTRIIFFATVFISCIGLIVDGLNFRFISENAVISNLITLIIIVTAYLLYQFRILKLSISFSIIAYVMLINIIIAYIIVHYGPQLVNFYLRDGIFVIYIMTIASLVINKKHGIIISAIYLIFAIVFAFVTGESFLIEMIPLQILLLAAYIGIIFYFVDKFEKLLHNQTEYTRTILEQHEMVQEANTLLEERQQIVEKQALELRTQKEVLIQTNQELKDTVATKDRFFSIISHDLRSPLSALIGFSELLYNNDIHYKESQLKKISKALYDSSISTFNLLENLLLWSRMQTSRIETNIGKIAVIDIIAESCNLLENIRKNKNIDLEIQVNKDQEVFVDKDMITSVFNNLLSNAIKFTPAGGIIKISTSLSDNHDLQVCISDNGIGIPSEIVTKLFRVDHSHSTEGTNNEKGSGLGLLLCKEFVERNGGKIWIESEPDKGSRFFFTLRTV